jgi:hypothetical protein
MVAVVVVQKFVQVMPETVLVESVVVQQEVVLLLLLELMVLVVEVVDVVRSVE